MAQGLRTRRLAWSLPLVLLGCSDEPAQPELQFASPDELVSAVLEHCHGPLQGGMDRVMLELYEADDSRVDLALWLPDRMRSSSDGTVDIMRDDRAWRNTPGEPQHELDHGARTRLVELRDLLRGLLLVPLYERETVTADESGITLDLKGGERWRLQLREGSLLPATLTGPAGEIEFLEYLTTSKTRLPRHVALGDRGERRVRFRGTDSLFFPELFGVAEIDAGLATLQVGSEPPFTLTVGGEHRPATPEITDIAAVSWLEMEDPGDWLARQELAAIAHRALGEQRQLVQGFTGFVAEDEIMVVPFSADPAGDNRTFEHAAGQTVRHLPDHRALVVYPEPGSYREAVANGSRQLREHVEREGLEISGPIRAYPYLHLGEEAPSKDDLSVLTIRLELPVK